MLNFGNKEFRNLQEQVDKNKQDIEDILRGTGVLNEFGIKVIGRLDSEEDLPESAEEYGDAYAIGTEAPYEMYIWTRNMDDEEPGWFNIGEFPKAGADGEPGTDGTNGLSVSSVKNNTEYEAWLSSAVVGDTCVSADDFETVRGSYPRINKGDILRKTGTNTDLLLGNIKGAKGDTGDQGPAGADGAQGPAGPRGESGAFILKGQVTTIAELPDPEYGERSDAYLVGAEGSEHLYVKIGEIGSLEWYDYGTVPFDFADGDGISIQAGTISVDSTVLRTTGAQSKTGVMTFASGIVIQNYSSAAFQDTQGNTGASITNTGLNARDTTNTNKSVSYGGQGIKYNINNPYGVTTYTYALPGQKNGTLALLSDIPTVSYPVTSVNSKTGAVTLTADDIYADNAESIQTNLERIDSEINRVEAEIPDVTNYYEKVSTVDISDDGSGDGVIKVGPTNDTRLYLEAEQITFKDEFDDDIVKLSCEVSDSPTLTLGKLGSGQWLDIANNSIECHDNDYANTFKLSTDELRIETKDEHNNKFYLIYETDVDYNDEPRFGFGVRAYNSSDEEAGSLAYGAGGYGLQGLWVYPATINSINIPSSSGGTFALASQNTMQTTAPTAPIFDGGIHIVHLSAEPATYYDGYIYLIDEE